MLIFENHDPTETEKEMFRYGGFYKIIDNEEFSRYALVHVNNRESFPERLKVEPQQVEYDKRIIFYRKSETVEGYGTFDDRLLDLMTVRMKELGWEI